MGICFHAYVLLDVCGARGREGVRRNFRVLRPIRVVRIKNKIYLKSIYILMWSYVTTFMVYCDMSNSLSTYAYTAFVYTWGIRNWNKIKTVHKTWPTISRSLTQSQKGSNFGGQNQKYSNSKQHDCVTKCHHMKSKDKGLFFHDFHM